MRAGTFRDRVGLQRLTTVDDPKWGPAGSYEYLGEVWASVRATQATEATAGSSVRSEITYEIRLRYRPDVSDQNRVIYRGRILDVLSAIDPDGRRRELVCVAKEHPAIPELDPGVTTDV